MARTFESMTLRGVRLKLWCFAPFRRDPLKQWGIAFVKNVTPKTEKKG